MKIVWIRVESPGSRPDPQEARFRAGPRKRKTSRRSAICLPADQGTSLSLSLGKRVTSLMFSSPVSVIISLSSPSPNPA
jgi:hypothetical protein